MSQRNRDFKLNFEVHAHSKMHITPNQLEVGYPRSVNELNPSLPFLVGSSSRFTFRKRLFRARIFIYDFY